MSGRINVNISQSQIQGIAAIAMTTTTFVEAKSSRRDSRLETGPFAIVSGFYDTNQSSSILTNTLMVVVVVDNVIYC
jgi:flagellar hook-associated protein FlgK